ncbi:MAG: ATP-binding protein [Nitrospirota bacterium]|nr:ATP-binding protein [Nitrospirota bacterium]
MRYLKGIIILLVLTGLYFASLYNYLLFHSIVEVFSIVISFGIFMFSWNSRRFQDNDYFLFLGILYLFVGLLDLLHTLSYTGMNIFIDYDYYANQLWIATRALESVSLVIAFFFLGSKRRDFHLPVLAAYTAVFALIVLSIFYWKTFPVCFVEGQGQTPFKIISEYIISSVLIAGIVMLFMNKNHFDKNIFRLLFYSFFFTIISELAFTFYVSNYGLSNMIGHYFKVFSFYMIYKAIIETGLIKPYDLLFTDLQKEKAAVEIYAQELKEMNASKDKLFSIISHDLRSPFTSIIGFSELMMNRSDMFSKEKMQEFIGDIHASAKELNSLLENLLQWATIQRGKTKAEPAILSLDRLIESNISVLSVNAKNKGIELINHVQDDIPVYADQNMINSVLMNLISNAVKFTCKGGKVNVEARLKHGIVETVVTDTGVGMSEARLKSLFKVDAAKSARGTEGEPGTGLGLVLCKDLIAMNNGTLRAESRPGEGSAFTFTLPANIPGDQPPSTSSNV